MASARLPAADRETTGLGDLENHVGFALRLAQMAVFQDLIQTLRPWGLRVTDFSVLMVIGDRPGLNQQAAGAMLQIQPPNLNTIMDRLRQQNLVRRTPIPEDGRSYALSLTLQGQQLLASAKEAHAEHERRLLARLEGLDVPTVFEALRRIATL